VKTEDRNHHGHSVRSSRRVGGRRRISERRRRTISSTPVGDLQQRSVLILLGRLPKLMLVNGHGQRPDRLGGTNGQAPPVIDRSIKPPRLSQGPRWVVDPFAHGGNDIPREAVRVAALARRSREPHCFDAERFCKSTVPESDLAPLPVTQQQGRR
jgi:hypothetical protein